MILQLNPSEPAYAGRQAQCFVVAVVGVGQIRYLSAFQLFRHTQRIAGRLLLLLEDMLTKIGFILFIGYYGIVAIVGILFREHLFDGFMVIFFVFGTFPLMMIMFFFRQRYKKWTPEIKSILERQGFFLVDERPTNFEETILYGTPIKALGKWNFSTRILTVIDDEIQRKFCVYLSKSSWNGKVKIEVIKEINRS